MGLSKPLSAGDRDACNTVQTSSGRAEFRQLTAAAWRQEQARVEQAQF